MWVPSAPQAALPGGEAGIYSYIIVKFFPMDKGIFWDLGGETSFWKGRFGREREDFVEPYT